MTGLDLVNPDHLVVPGLEFTATGVRRTGPDVRLSEVIDVLSRMPRVEAALHWTVGDLILVHAAETSLPETLQALGEVSPLAQATLAKVVVVCRRIPFEQRRPALSWSHHEQVAHLGPDDRFRLLDVAEAERLSLRALRAVMRQEWEDRHPEPLPAMERLPRPPEGALRAILAEHGPAASVVWQPSTGMLRHHVE